MELPRLAKQTIRYIFPLKARIKFLWKCRVLKMALSSDYQISRVDIELTTAEEFVAYLNCLNQVQRVAIIERLKVGLDQASQTEVDRFIANKNYVLKHNLLDTRVLFTRQEIAEQAECSLEFKRLKRWLFSFKFKNYNPESFYGLSGLRWLPDLAKVRLQNGVVFDIGAYDGDSAVSLSKAFKPALIYAFEPEQHNFNRLVANSKILGCEIVRPVQLGVFNQAGEASITNKEDSSKIVIGIGGSIKLTTIDDFVATNNIKQVDLIKMDIEGDEFKALQGAAATIKRQRPILAISIYHNPADFFGIKPWLQELCPEYNFIIKRSHPFAFDRETMLLAY